MKDNHLKLLIISYEFVPLLGGAGTYARELAVGLARNNVKVYIITCYHGTSNSNHKIDKYLKNEYGIIIKRFHTFGKIYFLQLFYYLFKWYGIKYPNKFIYIILADARSVRFSMVFILKKYWKKCVNVFHGGQLNKIYREPSYWIRLTGINKKFKSYLINSCANITVSEFQRNQYLEIFPELRHKLFTVHHGVDEKLFKPIPILEKILIRKMYGVKSEDIVVISASRLTKNKGQDYLLKAFAKIQNKYPKVKIILAGIGDYSEELKQLTKRLGLENKIKFTGQLSREKLAMLIAACDVSVMLSRIPFEAFGLVNLEANACGLPVLATNKGGVPEAVEHGVSGIVVDPENEEEISEKLEYLFHSPNRKKLGASARNRVLMKHTCTLMAKTSLDIITKSKKF